MSDSGRGLLLFIPNELDFFFSHRLAVAQEAERQGWRIAVAAHGASTDARLEKFGYMGYELPRQRFGLRPLNELKIMLAIRALIKKVKPDMIHAVTFKYVFHSGLAAMLTLQKTRILYMITGLGFLFDRDSSQAAALRLLTFPLIRLIFRKKASRVIVQNKDDSRTLRAYGLMKEDKVSIIRGSGVDLQDYAYKPMPKDKPMRVLMATRLIREKGVLIYCEAARLLKERGVEVECQLAGGFDTANPNALSIDDIQPYIEDGSILYRGKVSDIGHALSHVHIAALPSYYREGLPKFLLEAAATGRAVITTDSIGCREAVEDNRTGVLIRPRDAKALARAIENAADDPERLEKMGIAGRSYVEKHFDAHDITKKICALYSRIK